MTRPFTRDEVRTLLAAATPGPWSVARMDCGDYFGEQIAPDVTGELLGVSDADGRILAAAPDLAAWALAESERADALAAERDALAAELAEARAELAAELEDRPTWADVVDTAEATSEAADRRLAALVAEVAELRAELAAERGEEAGALPGWRISTGDYLLGNVADVGCDDAGWRWAVGSDAPDDALDDVWAEGVEKSARAAMRAAEAEARRLGLIWEVKP